MRHCFEISVSPVEGGWSVECVGRWRPMLFLSGARAEQQARAIARRLSDSGDDVQVTVRDRDRVLVGSTRYFAPKLRVLEGC